MGTMQRLGRGIAEASSILGKGLEREEDRAEEKRRYDEQMRIRKERHEADLYAMDRRNRALELSNNIKKLELNNKLLTQTFAQSNGDPKQVCDAITKYGNGYVERYNEPESARQSNINGYPTIVTDNGVYETNEKGDPVIGPDGKKIFKPLPGSATQTSRTRAEFNDHFADIVNPNVALARIQSKQTYKDLYNRAEAQFKAQEASEARKAETAEGKLKRRKLEAQTTEAEKLAKGISTKPPVAKVKNIKGQEVDRTHAEAEADIAAMKIMAKDNPEWGITSPDQAYRINQLKNSPKLRAAIADDVQKALEDEAFAEKFVKKGSQRMGVPAEFLQDLLDRAEINREVIASKKGGFVNWVKEFFSGKGEAPPAYNKKAEAPKGLVF